MRHAIAIIMLLLSVSVAWAQRGDTMIEDFSDAPASRWTFITDGVMGGVSEGQVALERSAGQTVLHMVGTVSTANNGGFIQARQTLRQQLPSEAVGLELRVKGNGQTYFVHARTAGTVLPWTYYQASFEANPDWTVVRIPFSGFRAEGKMLRQDLTAQAVETLAIVAYGRDHIADVSVAWIGFY